jgi:hypothetical protein
VIASLLFNDRGINKGRMSVLYTIGILPSMYNCACTRIEVAATTSIIQHPNHVKSDISARPHTNDSIRDRLQGVDQHSRAGLATGSSQTMPEN